VLRRPTLTGLRSTSAGRKLPAIVLAKQFIEQGKIGQIRHFNAAYYQDWLVDPRFPYGWRNDIKEGGSGAHGDMSSHTVDLARYLLGEFEAVNGMQQVFIKERKAVDQKTHPVTADDATCFIAKFRNGAMGSFVSTRFAAGRKNYLRLEIFGSKGSLIFDLERLNELEYYSAADQDVERGFRNILVTDHRHPYVGFWWPPSHIIGWEHTFIHEIRDFLTAIEARQALEPDFGDGLRCQYVLDAVQQSARNGKWVQIPE
jgi:predicted dehydrogenase